MLEIENQNVERIPETIQKLKKEKNIYVYGDGDLAHTVIQELYRWNIKIEGVLVSEGRKQKDTLYPAMITIFLSLCTINS